eukprot:TRINITY_DN7736_c0_g1_i2.p1 TRINITY_DN7736_c0_g1~~TRINITY_DN7736_c0_g1_i2.p1  ORF type:complete len:174 (-),score=63.57 TRINITY_DN7736_c0_g1_i2:91-612(-)
MSILVPKEPESKEEDDHLEQDQSNDDEKTDSEMPHKAPKTALKLSSLQVEEKLELEFGGLSSEETKQKLQKMSQEEQERLQERLQEAMLESTAALKNNVQNILDSLKKDNQVLSDTNNAVDLSTASMKKANADLEARLRRRCGSLFTTMALYLSVIVSFFLMIFFMKVFPKPK